MANIIKVPLAAWNVTLDGKSITDILDPILICVTLRETRESSADELTIEIKDIDGRVELPALNKKIKVALGWARGSNIPIGLVSKGEFTVDEVSLSGVNGTISISARSANFTQSFQTRRNHSYIGKTLGQILNEIAGRNNYTLVIDATFAAKAVPNISRHNTSDAAIFRYLGRRYDAIATIKDGRMIFGPIGSGKTARGTKMPTFEIQVSDIEPSSLNFRAAEREHENGAEATVHDRKTGQTTNLTHGKNEQNSRRPHRLRRIYHNHDHAKRDCQAHSDRQKRKGYTCEFQLPIGRPDIFPNTPITLKDFKSIISDKKWVVKEIQTEMGPSGLKSSLTLETV